MRWLRQVNDDERSSAELGIAGVLRRADDRCESARRSRRAVHVFNARWREDSTDPASNVRRPARDSDDRCEASRRSRQTEGQVTIDARSREDLDENRASGLPAGRSLVVGVVGVAAIDARPREGLDHYGIGGFVASSACLPLSNRCEAARWSRPGGMPRMSHCDNRCEASRWPRPVRD